MRFKLSLLLFIIGLMFIFAGHVQDTDPKCKPKTEIRIVPRNVYDQLIKDSIL